MGRECSRFLLRRLAYACAAARLALWCISPSVSNALPIAKPSESKKVWREAEIDYSAANEYVRVHYGGVLEQPYFATPGGNGRAVEPIYDAREGFWDVRDGRAVEPSLERCGFELQQSPSLVTDFADLDQICSIYLPHLRSTVMPKAFCHERISDIVFWFPMYRAEDQVINSGAHAINRRLPTEPIAPLAHIDTDVGAFDDVDALVTFVDKNRVDDDVQKLCFSSDAVAAALRSGRRFAIVNTWRNANLDQPVLRAPLAVLSTQYTCSDGTQSRIRCFPDSRPDFSRSRWYTFPRMSHDECMLFLQYDRNIQRPSDLWHCALASVREEGALPRRSFDVRALVVFEDIVQPKLDRFAHDRTRPLLSREEEECFCQEQATVEIAKVQKLLQKLQD